VSRHDDDVSPRDGDTAAAEGDTSAPQDWPVTLMRRIPVNPGPYRRWLTVWADLQAGESDLRKLARRHHFDLRSVQAIRRAGQLGILDHPDPPARRLAGLATAAGRPDPPPPPTALTPLAPR
jgi:hypothetical protein